MRKASRNALDSTSVFFQMYFHHHEVSPPLGPLLREKRESLGWTFGQASLATGLSESEIESFESDRFPNPRLARLSSVTYARALGIDPAEIRGSLPPAPVLVPGGRVFLSNLARPSKPRWRPSLKFLAPMGKAALYFVMITCLLVAWGMIHKLARVRRMP